MSAVVAGALSREAREMLHRTIRLCVMATGLAAVLWPSARADACWFRPGCLRDLLPVAGETLPANFAVVGMQGCTQATHIAFTAERDGETRSVEFDQAAATGDSVAFGEHRTAALGFDVLQIRSPLAAGDTLVLRYVVEDDEDAGTHEVEARWPIGEEERLPASLGHLNVRQDDGVIRVAADESCARDMMSSYADVALDRSETLKPWLPRLRYELRVDDKPWIYYSSLEAPYDTGSWYSSLGRGKDRVVLGCEVDPHRPVINSVHRVPEAIDPGPHRVRMLGFLPTGEALSSEEIVVDMQCAPDSARALKAQLDACAEAKTENHLSALDADGGDTASCSVALPGRARGPSALALLWLGLCFYRLRRRVRMAAAPGPVRITGCT